MGVRRCGCRAQPEASVGRCERRARLKAGGGRWGVGCDRRWAWGRGGATLEWRDEGKGDGVRRAA